MESLLSSPEVILTRYAIYRSRKARTPLCYVAARSAKRALACARGMFRLERDAAALPDRSVCQNLGPESAGMTNTTQAA